MNLLLQSSMEKMIAKSQEKVGEHDDGGISLKNRISKDCNKYCKLTSIGWWLFCGGFLFQLLGEIIKIT